MVYGYARVSTRLQANDGNSLEAQEKMLSMNGAEEIFRDTFTGSKCDRPQLDILKSRLVPGDKVVITKLDRLARSTEEGLALIREWRELGISIHVLNMGMIDNTPTGKLIFTVLLAFAEFERDMIVERTREGREIARQNPDYRDGRKKKYSRKQISHAIELLDNHSYSQVVQMTGISKSTLIRAQKG